MKHNFNNQVSNDECIKMIPNRFQLVLVAAQRAKELSYGSRPKTTNVGVGHCVTALNEIQEGHVGIEYLLKLARKS